MKTKIFAFLSSLATFLFITTPALAQVGLGTIQGTGKFQTGKQNEQLSNFISTILQTLTIVAGLSFLLYFVMGGMKWITSSGDKGRAEEAKTELTQSAIGLIVVAVSYFVVGIVGGVVGIDILNPCNILDTDICK